MARPDFRRPLFHTVRARAGQHPDLWGRLVESAVGAHLVNTAAGPGTTVTYWRDGRDEVDFVLGGGPVVVGVEVKSGRNAGSFAGLERFRRGHPGSRSLIVGTGGIGLEEFLSSPADSWSR